VKACNSRLCLEVANCDQTYKLMRRTVCVISARPYGQRAVLKFAAHTGAVAIAGRFTPGNFTNYITRSFKEPRLIIVTDPRTDAQAIKEASYVNIPVIVCLAFEIVCRAGG